MSGGKPASDEGACGVNTRAGSFVACGLESSNYANNATWTWDGTNWTQQSPVNHPPPSYGHAIAYDTARNQILLFGGTYIIGYRNDTWLWDGTNWARETAHMLADYGIVWFEEALPPDDIEGYIELTRVSPVPIATGEVLTRRQSFIPWLERRAVDIIQPDSTKNGGLSESRRIAWMAYDHNIQMVSHGWNTVIGLAADLQLAAAMPIARYVEYLTPCAYIEDLTVEPFRVDSEGYLEIPTTPGLGFEIDREKLKKKYDARR